MPAATKLSRKQAEKYTHACCVTTELVYKLVSLQYLSLFDIQEARQPLLPLDKDKSSWT